MGRSSRPMHWQRKSKKNGGDCEYIEYSVVHTRTLKRRVLYAIGHTGLYIKKILNKIVKKDVTKQHSYWDSEDFRITKEKIMDFVAYNIPVSSVKFNKDNIDESLGVYSLFLVGSDQTWSEDQMENTDVYLLPFVHERNRKASYAPSLGKLHLTESYLKKLSDSISSFCFVSCREERNCRLLSRLSGNHIQFVLDPTLLLSSNDWEERMVKYEIEEPYILCYILGERNEISEFAEVLSIHTGIPVKYVVTRPAYLNKKGALNGIGPLEFVYLVSKASYVVTDSFHGTIFSINFKKEFYSFCKREGTSKSSDNARIMDILSTFGLENRFKEDSNPQFELPINYSEVNSKLAVLRDESIQYLRTIINHVNKNDTTNR